MIRRSFVSLSALPLAALSLATIAPASRLAAQSGGVPPASADEFQRYSANQLDNLVGPIALYPDALLAQVLVAATFPDQIVDAARWVRENGTSGIDEQPWDVSVRAVAHYPSALNMMADRSDWMATLGRAYANQSSDVMTAVQRMRALADKQGNLVSTSQQQVVNEDDTYIIVPRQPRVIYVPVYDPILVYTQPVFNVAYSSRYWSFGIGFPIGSWLSYDLDWRARNVYYNGWGRSYLAYGGGWRERSLPFIQINNYYVGPRYRTVYVNRDVWRRPVDYRNVDRFGGYHRDTYFDNHRVAGNENRVGDTRSPGDFRNTRGRDDDDRIDRRGGDPRVTDRGGRDDGRPGNDDKGRTAKPREGSGVASPDGYRRGNDRNEAPRESRPPVAVPERRRADPSVRTPDVIATPEVSRAPRNDSPRGESPHNDAPRGDFPRGESRGAPRAEQPRVAAPRQESPRQESLRQESPRQESPRQSAPRQDAPRAQSRGDGGERRTAAPRGGDRSAGDRNGGRRGN